jgi:hypothetical protein
MQIPGSGAAEERVNLIELSWSDGAEEERESNNT